METNYTSFLCKKCQTEIQASLDMIGQETECPACGTHMIIPDIQADGVLRHGPDDADPDAVQAMKSRTIRIELEDI